jgi:hypothetical protein
MEAPFLPLVSEGLFWCLVFDAVLVFAQATNPESSGLQPQSGVASGFRQGAGMNTKTRFPFRTRGEATLGFDGEARAQLSGRTHAGLTLWSRQCRKSHTYVCRRYNFVRRTPRISAILTKSVNDLAPIFLRCPRCIFTVISARPISAAICLFKRPIPSTEFGVSPPELETPHCRTR